MSHFRFAEEIMRIAAAICIAMCFMTPGFARAQSTSAAQQAPPDLDQFEQTYAVAISSGMTALSARNFEGAREAFEQAAILAEAAGDTRAFERGRALALRGIAVTTPVLDGRGRVPLAEARSAFADFADARRLLYPFAAIAAPDGAVTPQQLTYAQALAWDGALRVRMEGNRQDVPEPFQNSRTDAYIVRPPNDPPECWISMHRPMPAYPNSVASGGSVIVRVRFSEDGEVLGMDAPIGVGDPSLLQAVRNILARWTASYDTARPPGCAVPPIYFVRISFDAR
jgi:hypothetical protein